MSDTGTDQDQARQRLAVWWQSLDPSVKGMFEQIAAEQPDLVYRVISGGTVTPSEGQTLEQHLGDVDASAAIQQIPTVYVVATPVIEPAYPEPGTSFTVKWEEEIQNSAPASHRTTVTVTDDSGATVAERELTGLNGAGSREVTFDGGLQADGGYTVLVWANADGVDPGTPATEQGYRAGAGAYLQVGSYASGAGPSGAAEAYWGLAAEMSDAAQMLSFELTAERVVGAFDAAARLIGAGPEAQRALISGFDNWKDLVRNHEERAGRLEQPAGDEVAYVQQAATVWSSLQHSDKTYEDNAPYLVETLTALARAVTGQS
ncbi:MAG TPA: hypothetical protein VF855_13305 [Acidimicrobiales bacterium]